MGHWKRYSQTSRLSYYWNYSCNCSYSRRIATFSHLITCFSVKKCFMTRTWSEKCKIVRLWEDLTISVQIKLVHLQWIKWLLLKFGMYRQNRLTHTNKLCLKPIYQEIKITYSFSKLLHLSTVQLSLNLKKKVHQLNWLSSNTSQT